MRLDLIIAIFISAALHAAFAYGDKIIALFWHPAPQIQQVAEEEKVIQIKTMPEDLIEPPEPVDSNEEVSQEQISFVPPMQADVPSPQIDNSFQQALQPPPPPTDFGQTAIAIPTGPIGPALKDQIKLFDTKDLDQQPSPRYQSQPVYPFDMKREGKSGAVVVGFVIDEKGNVRDVHVIQSTERGFEDSAVAAVRNWSFRPGRKDGIAVSTRMRVPIKFNIEDAE